MNKKITKTMLAAAAVLLMSMGAKATVHTVNNGVINGGHFTSLQTAVDSATAGDTIYVHGSPNSYGTVTINKKLSLIGAGYGVTGTSTNYNTYIDNIYLDSIPFVSGSTGCIFIGLNYSQMTNNGSGAPYNIKISRCYSSYNTAISHNNWLIENSVFGGGYLSLGSITNCIVRNCVIASSFGGNGSNYSSVILDHNIFEFAPSGMNYALFTNNVFFFCGASSGWSGINNCIFNKNLTFETSVYTLPYGSNTGTGNVSAVMPTYQFYNTLSSIVQGVTILTTNWRLKTTSVGHNAATDGTDIGIYGGTYSMPNLTGVSNLIPQMTLMNITNTSIPLNGTLNVNFKSRKQN